MVETTDTASNLGQALGALRQRHDRPCDVCRTPFPALTHGKYCSPGCRKVGLARERKRRQTDKEQAPPQLRPVGRVRVFQDTSKSGRFFVEFNVQPQGGAA
jgi:hypothetical protein